MINTTVCVCVCTCTYILGYVCVHMYIYIYTWVCVCAHRYIYTGVWMCVYMYIYTGVCVGVHTYMYIGVHIDVHTHTHTHIVQVYPLRYLIPMALIPTKCPRIQFNSFWHNLSAVRIKFHKLKGSAPQDCSHFRHQIQVFILLTNWLWIGGSHGSLSGLIIS